MGLRVILPHRRATVNNERHHRALRASALVAVLVAALLVGSRFFQPLGYAALPFCLPGLLLLGADETQKRFGYWGELGLFWLLSLPCLAIYASLAWRGWQRRRSAKPLK